MLHVEKTGAYRVQSHITEDGEALSLGFSSERASFVRGKGKCSHIVRKVAIRTSSLDRRQCIALA